MTAASRLPVKQFDSIPGTVHEDIDISVARITSKYIGHDAAEGVITLFACRWAGCTAYTGDGKEEVFLIATSRDCAVHKLMYHVINVSSMKIN